MNEFIDTCGWLLKGVLYLVIIVGGVIIIPALIASAYKATVG